MGPKELDQLIEKYLEGKCTEDERRLIDSLYASLGKPEFDTSDNDESQSLKNVEERILSNVRAHAKGRSRRRYFWQYTGIAASLVFLLAAGFYFIPLQSPAEDAVMTSKEIEKYEQIENTSSVSTRTILPDGTIVNVSPGSTIRFSTDPDAPARELFLEGEGYFDVAHNNARPFYVYARNVVTKVLGTSFTVSARGTDEKVTVSVKTGKVTVYSRKASHKKTVLTENQEAVYDDATEQLAAKKASTVSSSELEIPVVEMRFDETPVSEVLRSLTETYEIAIDFNEKAVSGCVLTSSFLEEGLYDRIDVICTAIGATYSIVDGRITIESEGCNLKTD